MEYPKFQASYMNGSINLTVRGGTADEVSKGLKRLLLQARTDVAPLIPNNPIGSSGSNKTGKTKIKPQNCPGHQFYVATVKKDGANKGRRFKACKNCNYFEWADGPYHF